MPPQPDVWAYERERLVRPPTPGEQEHKEAYEWCLRDPEVQRQHLGQLVVVQKGIVWGSGNTWKEAWEAALSKPGCPARAKLVCVLVPGELPTDTPVQQEGAVP